MSDDDKLEIAIRDFIIDICEVMHRRGYSSVSIGAMMRLIGVGEDRARQHDDQFFTLDQEFQDMLDVKKFLDQKSPPPPDAVIH